MKTVYGVMFLASLCLTTMLIYNPQHLIIIEIGEWFHVGHYKYPLAFHLDKIAMLFVALTVTLTGIVGSFSITYLHRDAGFLRFFLLLFLFTFGALLVFTASSLDLLIAGWELVGITSVLLIGFFQYRPEPVSNALRVFATYRVADLFILVSVFLAHHWFGSAEWSRFEMLTGNSEITKHIPYAVPTLAILLVFAASGKAAQGPFCSWLARAMEGPTPSSAIFYGAISVHAGPYLLLRIEPLIRQSSVAIVLLMFIGFTTALVSTMVQRSSTDSKTSLAYAAQTQLGIIFMEIALGWHTLALVHIAGHAIVRALQFLRSPSMLSDYHGVRSGAGGKLTATGSHYNYIISEKLQHRLYCFTLFRGYHDALLERFLIQPLYRFSKILSLLDTPHSLPSKKESLEADRNVANTSSL
jgi:NADH-quinone oxidoreductase subunit L